MSEDFFEANNLGIQMEKPDNLVVGQSYPLYGMITEIFSDEPGNVEVQLNMSIRLRLNVSEQEKIDLLKTRVFETGIFVSTLVEIEPEMIADCTTIVFGKRKEFDS
jgi:hypothetical protein